MFHPRIALLVEYTNRIEEPNHSAMRRLLLAEGERIALSPGSTHNHQTWPGGYVDHMVGMIEVGQTVYGYSRKKHAFSFGDLVLVVLLHDIEKPWKYVDKPEGTQRVFNNPAEIKAFTQEIIQHYGFVLNDQHLNALKYAHGEGDDYRPDQRVNGPLGAMLHICDYYSARIEFDRRILPPLEG